MRHQNFAPLSARRTLAAGPRTWRCRPALRGELAVAGTPVAFPSAGRVHSMTEVIVVFPGGARISTTIPGLPRRGDTVAVRWGASSTPTRYAVEDVTWNLNDLRVLVHLAVGSAGS